MKKTIINITTFFKCDPKITFYFLSLFGLNKNNTNTNTNTNTNKINHIYEISPNLNTCAKNNVINEINSKTNKTNDIQLIFEQINLLTNIIEKHFLIKDNIKYDETNQLIMKLNIMIKLYKTKHIKNINNFKQSLNIIKESNKVNNIDDDKSDNSHDIILDDSNLDDSSSDDSSPKATELVE
jgi:hypothetical protein